MDHSATAISHSRFVTIPLLPFVELLDAVFRGDMSAVHETTIARHAYVKSYVDQTGSSGVNVLNFFVFAIVLETAHLDARLAHSLIKAECVVVKLRMVWGSDTPHAGLSDEMGGNAGKSNVTALVGSALLSTGVASAARGSVTHSSLSMSRSLGMSLRWMSRIDCSEEHACANAVQFYLILV